MYPVTSACLEEDINKAAMRRTKREEQQGVVSNLREVSVICIRFAELCTRLMKSGANKKDFSNFWGTHLRAFKLIYAFKMMANKAKPSFETKHMTFFLLLTEKKAQSCAVNKECDQEM